MFAKRNGWSIKRNGGDWMRDVGKFYLEDGGRKNRKNWNGGSGSAGKRPQVALLGTGFPS